MFEDSNRTEFLNALMYLHQASDEAQQFIAAFIDNPVLSPEIKTELTKAASTLNIQSTLVWKLNELLMELEDKASDLLGKIDQPK